MKEFPPIPIPLFEKYEAMIHCMESGLKFAAPVSVEMYFAELERYCAEHVFPRYTDSGGEQYDNRRAKR